MQRYILLLFVFTCLQSHGRAHDRELLVISDIDDTVRPTNALNIYRAIPNLFKGETFLGFQDLYTTLVCQEYSSWKKYRSCAQQRGQTALYRTIAYVTAFPSFYLAKKYLKKSRLPYQDILRSKPVWQSTYEFKLKAHLDIIKKYPAKHILLIGDNGQEDIKVFAKVRKRLEALAHPPKITILVHQVYDQEDGVLKIPEKQIPFLSYFDLGASLVENKLLNVKNYLNLIKKYRSVRFDKKHPLFSKLKPSWVKCLDFRYWYEDHFKNFSENYNLGKNYKNDEIKFLDFLEESC